ncbi:MAG: hypothetical protein N2049_06830, partial [Anaerolineales bacterium]|nr:hypothetical protein [Anaerolineales bacterium]
MPELPEVETIVRHLRPVLVGRMIRGVDLRWPRTLVTPTAEDFQEQLLGQQILALSRRAKYIVIHLARRYLLVHLRMSGDLFVRNQGQAPGLHDRLIVTLSEGVDLVFNDPRKFGRIWLVADPDTVFADLGPEPFSDVFTAAWLFAALHARRRQLKPLLLDQTFLAGLGNIYADEALHRARLHPLRWSNTVEEGEAA